MLYVIVLYVRPSVCFYVNSWTSRRRRLKFCTYIVQVKSDIEFEDGSRTWALTRSNWRFSYCTLNVHVRLHSVHVRVPIPVEYLYICATAACDKSNWSNSLFWMHYTESRKSCPGRFYHCSRTWLQNQWEAKKTPSFIHITYKASHSQLQLKWSN